MTKSIKLKNTWDLTKLYFDDDPNIQKDKDEIFEKSYLFINKWKNRTDYLTDAKILKQALDEYEYWSKKYGLSGKIGYFYSLKTALDQANPKYKAESNKLYDFEVKILNDIQFFHLNLAKIEKKNQDKFLNDPVLFVYKHYLYKIFEQAKYLLSEREEKILNEKEKVSYNNWVSLVSELISKQEKVTYTDDGKSKKKHTFSELLTLSSNKNKKVRQDVGRSLERIFEKYLEIAEAEINSILENKMINDKLRGFVRPDQARHLSDDIESGVVDILLSAVTERFDISKRFYSLKAKLLHQKNLKYYERSVECFESKLKYSFGQSADILINSLGVIDGQMKDIFLEYLNGGHFDVYPRKNKTEGAFCTHLGILHPTYILLNHTGRFEDVLTLAHEVGHGINNELIKSKQNELNFGTPTSTAEVASTLIEDLILNEILAKASRKDKLALIIKKLDMDIATIFRQTAFYNFELQLHQEHKNLRFLEVKYIGELFLSHMRSYMGDSAEGANNWWIYISHFRQFFYVYSYVSGLLISKSMQKMLQRDPNFINNIKDFLSAGLSDSPYNLFMKMGIDISKKDFWTAGINEVESLLNQAELLSQDL